MLASTGIKGLLAYRALRKMNGDGASTTNDKGNLVTSSKLSNATTPPSVVAMTGSAYAISKMTNAPKIQRFLLKSTLSASVAGLLNAGLKRLIGRKRPRAETGPDLKGPALKDKFNSMPSGHASAVAAVAGCIPRTSGPLLLASTAGLAATAVIGRSRTKRDAHHLSDVLVGSCLGFGVAYAVSKLEKPVEAEVENLKQNRHMQK
ncbi:PAP2 family protein [Alteromonas sp. BL110]|uniref:phosphatase PAP2 family protein n=1 Tax=Alteromonas sp. BL110 TaxID=1714845 RepID=UPI000E4D35C1|nr:phosphatase PAP2 family protein [Alteromonas sp. BL110]AXT39844.1 PAP2 family protein [Alteromonas sp. BL110]RKM79073.1 phosphatase PAP2 family protein [Alteromonas sp. BL110]